MVVSSSLICINIVLLSGISFISSPAIFKRLFPSLEPFFPSLLLPDASFVSNDEVRASTVLDFLFTEGGVEALIFAWLFSVSTSFAVSILVLGAATIVDGSADSCVLSKT